MILSFKKVGDGVFISQTPIVSMGEDEMKFIQKEAFQAKMKRARICAHRSNTDEIHEMLIAINSDSYIRPHKHIGKSESVHIVQGECDIVIFHETGEIEDVICLGELKSGRNFYYRLSEEKYHTLVPNSKQLILHETTNGPFDITKTDFAPFAPPEGDMQAIRQYMDTLFDNMHIFRRGETL